MKTWLTILSLLSVSMALADTPPPVNVYKMKAPGAAAVLVANGSGAVAPIGPGCVSGYLLTYTGSAWACQAAPASGVTSVALALPSDVFGVSGSPVTSTGTLTAVFNTQAANSFLSGPVNGSPGVPAFRSMVAADVPSITSSKISDFTSAARGVISATAPVAYDSSTGVVSCIAATGSVAGCLSAADWTTFNGKQAAGNYLTALTSDVSASGPGSAAATVNSVGGSSAANVHAAELLANAATSSNTINTLVKRNGSGAASLDVTGNVTGNVSGSAASITGNLTGDATSVGMVTTVASVGGSSAANVHTAELLANAATSSATASTIAKRNASGYIPYDSSGPAPIVARWYVCALRTDTYTADGSLQWPYKTITAAVSGIVASGLNSPTHQDVIDVYCPSTNAETVSLNNAALYNIFFQGHGWAQVTTITSTSSNTQLANLYIEGFTIGNLTLTGGTNGTGFLGNDASMRSVFITDSVAINNAGSFVIYDSKVSNNLSFININSGAMVGGDGMNPTGTFTVTTNNAANVPSGFGGTSVIIEKALLGVPTLSAGATLQIRESSRVAYGGAAISISGDLIDYGAVYRGDITINSGGTWTTNGSTYSGSLTNSGTITANGTFKGNLSANANLKGKAPTSVTSCGGGTPSVVGNNSVGRITVGTGGSATSCTLNFSENFTNIPICVLSDETTSLLLKAAPTTSALVITSATPFGASDKIGYQCFGYL